jgi:proteasome lid subunit RPN8/RPN11
MRAIEEDDDDEVRQLLNSEADINAQDEHGVTALMLAVQKGDVETVWLLLDSEADINAQDEHGVTALMLAVQKDDIETVWLLLDKGADVNKRQEAGFTALMFSLLGEDLYIARLLLDKGADINIQDNDGLTPLSCAVQNGFYYVELLLAKGADANTTNKIGETPFEEATRLLETEPEEYHEDIEETLKILVKYQEKKANLDADIHTSTKKREKSKATKSKAGNSNPALKPESALNSTGIVYKSGEQIYEDMNEEQDLLFANGGSGASFGQESNKENNPRTPLGNKDPANMTTASEDPDFQHLRHFSLQLANSIVWLIVFSFKFLKECRALYH